MNIWPLNGEWTVGRKDVGRKTQDRSGQGDQGSARGMVRVGSQQKGFHCISPLLLCRFILPCDRVDNQRPELGMKVLRHLQFRRSSQDNICSLYRTKGKFLEITRGNEKKKKIYHLVKAVDSTGMYEMPRQVRKCL